MQIIGKTCITFLRENTYGEDFVSETTLKKEHTSTENFLR